MGRTIIAAIGGTVPGAIIHVQIEKDGQLQFAAYDNFHPECIHFGSAVKEGERYVKHSCQESRGGISKASHLAA
jgi:hypothetical protein